MASHPKKTAICIASTANRVYAIASVLMDIRRYAPNLADEVIILHNGIKERDQKLLCGIHQAKFIKYRFPILDQSKFSKTITDYFTTMVFAKFEAFKLLDSYSPLIMLDYDIVIQGNLSDIMKRPASGFLTVDKTAQRSNFFCSPVEGYDLNQESKIGSMWVLWDHLRNYAQIHEWCYCESERLAPHLLLPETGIISLALEAFDITPDQFLKSEEYDCHPKESHASRAKILHCWGQPKYWNGFHSEQWEQNYRQWIGMGGTPCFERGKASAIKEYVKGLYRKLRSRINAFFSIIS